MPSKTKKVVPFVPPFRTGDVVKYVGTSTWKKGETHIIHEYDPVREKYSTNLGAWYDHKDFELVRECDAESLAELVRNIRQEEDDEDD